jgi:rhamnosyltransferase
MADSVGIVVVSYHPGAGFATRLEGLLNQGVDVVLVDNGSDDASLAQLSGLGSIGNLITLRNPTNLGIATALNQGVAELRRRGARWALLLDQDSEPAPDMLSRLLATAQRHRHEPIAQVAANVQDRGLPTGTRRWFSLAPRFMLGFKRIRCDQDLIRDVVAVTSGSLVDIQIHEALGGFDERLFIDFVDTDYCLRAAAAGHATVVDCAAVLHHSVGAKQQRSLLGIKFIPTYHRPLRRYYLFRNRIHMVRAHAARWPHWVTYELAATVHTLVGILLFEDSKARQLRACALGTWDGMLRRDGEARRRP